MRCFNFFSNISLRCSTLVLLLAAVLGSTDRASGQGNLLVTPRRLVFENGARIRELNLANIGKDSARFLLSIMEIRMNPDGTFERIAEADSGQRFSSPYFRIYPRSVTIAPGESQMVKVQLTRSEGLDSGEYRSHIYVRAAQPDKAGKPATAGSQENIAVNLTAVFGVSIPAIIRVGTNDAHITLTDAALKGSDPLKPRLSLTMRRAGRMSTYGDLSVVCINAKGAETEVGIARGIAVYTPNTSRRFELDLDLSNVTGLKGSRLVARYATQKEDRHRDAAEISLNLPDLK